MVFMLGPSGEAQFSANSKAPGAMIVPAGVLNAVGVPVRVTATRRDGGVVFLAAAPATDVAALLSTSAVSTVSGVHFPGGRLDLHASGSGALPDLSNADVWRLTASGKGAAALLVDQGKGPEAVVVTSGDVTALSDATVTLTWDNRAWFFEALVMATIGAVLAAFALNDLWQGRAVPAPGDVAQVQTVEATI